MRILLYAFGFGKIGTYIFNWDLLEPEKQFCGFPSEAINLWLQISVAMET